MQEAETDSGIADRASLPGVRVVCLPAHGEGG